MMSLLFTDEPLGCECAWGPLPEPVFARPRPKTLLEGAEYLPSWLMDQPRNRYAVDHLVGHYGLCGLLVEKP